MRTTAAAAAAAAVRPVAPVVATTAPRMAQSTSMDGLASAGLALGGPPTASSGRRSGAARQYVDMCWGNALALRACA
jgi:hypothetical protein